MDQGRDGSCAFVTAFRVYQRQKIFNTHTDFKMDNFHPSLSNWHFANDKDNDIKAKEIYENEVRNAYINYLIKENRFKNKQEYENWLNTNPSTRSKKSVGATVYDAVKYLNLDDIIVKEIKYNQLVDTLSNGHPIFAAMNVKYVESMYNFHKRDLI